MIAMRYAQRFSSFFFFSDELDRITSGEWNFLCCSPGCSLCTHKCNTHTHTSLEVSGECVVSASLCYVPSCCFSDFFYSDTELEECVNCFCMSMTQKKEKNPGMSLGQSSKKWPFVSQKNYQGFPLVCFLCHQTSVLGRTFWNGRKMQRVQRDSAIQT